MAEKQNRFALCIGINNYPGTQNDLSGCVNDANDWAEELRTRAFEVKTLIDSQATKANIMHEIQGMLEKAGHGDQAVVTYSGHGTWEVDLDGDEPDQRDEALCPWDMAAGPLLDDDLFDLFAGRARGTRLVFLSDSCHSGTVAKFHLDNEQGRKVKFMNPAYYAKNERTLSHLRAVEKSRARGLSRTGALLIAGCADLEYSYDASFNKRPNGAFTRVALDTLRAKKPKTYRDWHQQIRGLLPSSAYPQTPNLVATSSQKKWAVFE
jgi:metacaspase-1